MDQRTRAPQNDKLPQVGQTLLPNDPSVGSVQIQGKQIRALSGLVMLDDLSDWMAIWAAVAATANPGIPGLKWMATDPDTNKTMVWDNECRMVNDPEGEARKIILA
jgi:carboxylesterase type B